jgi:hypothetical protein
MNDYDKLIDRIRHQMFIDQNNPDKPPYQREPLSAVATEAALLATEQSIGFALPPLLRRLYQEIANGGFGPGYGLIGVAGGATDDIGQNIADIFADKHSPNFQKWFPNWPAQAIGICHWGCAMYSVVDCSTPAYQMFHFEPNNLGITDYLIPHHRTFDEYITAWADGIDLMNDVFPGYADPLGS